MKVRPKDGLIVRDPVTFEKLPPEGREVPKVSYWLRRLAVGDVELIDDDEETADESAAPKSSSRKKKNREIAGIQEESGSQENEIIEHNAEGDGN